MTELWRLSATAAVDLLRSGKVSPVEMVEAAAARIAAVEPRINALPIRFLETARAEAKRYPARHDRAEDPRWLGGLPIAVKDYNHVGGQRTTAGSPIFADYVAPADDLTVATLRAQGAIPVAKSNVPEFAGAHTFNTVFGATRNPWDTGRSAGGSSGGAAAALAAGEVWLANGSCLGGSLRIPASFCGIVGLRPSPGRVPRGNGLPAFDQLWVEGPMARSVPDLALFLDAMAMETPQDPLSLPPPGIPYVHALRAARPPRRIGFSPDLGIIRTDPEVAALCRAGAARFAEMGAVVEEAAPAFSGAIEAFQTLRATMFAAVRGPLLEDHRDRIAPEIIWNIERGLDATGEDVIRAEQQRHALFHRVVAFFDTHDILALPTVAVPPFAVESRYPEEIGGVKATSYIDWMALTFALTLTSCPCLSLPCGFTTAGLPVGLQLVARPRDEAGLLGAAMFLEQALGLAGQVPRDPAAAGASA